MGATGQSLQPGSPTPTPRACKGWRHLEQKGNRPVRLNILQNQPTHAKGAIRGLNEALRNVQRNHAKILQDEVRGGGVFIGAHVWTSLQTVVGGRCHRRSSPRKLEAAEGCR